jgi:hypothetical protein
MDQYIHDNNEDEFTHQNFINAYLTSKGANPVNLDGFRILPGSQATGANTTKKRLTNLTRLTIDTSYWTRYRSRDFNPDLGDPQSDFPQAIPSLFAGQFPAIPRTDADLTPAGHIQAIANTAAAQHRADRNHALPDLARQGGQRASSDRSQKSQARVSQPQRIPLWRGGFPDQPDHARAMPVPQPEVSAMFCHTPDLEIRRRGGRQRPYGQRAVHRPNRRVL